MTQADPPRDDPPRDDSPPPPARPPDAAPGPPRDGAPRPARADGPTPARPPTPVRPAPARPAPARPAPARPTPVRQGIDAPDPVPPPPRRLLRTADDEVWTVTLMGRTRTGRRGDPGSHLMLLRFDRGEVEGEGADAGAREALVPGTDLDEPGDAVLRDALEGARPWGFERRELFPGTRRSRRDT